MLKKLFYFFKHYRWLAVVIVAVIISAVLSLTGNHRVANLILAITSIIATLPLVWDMWQTVRSGGYGLDILAVTAIVASVWLGEYWAGIIIVLMLTGGEALEDYAEERAKTELSELLKKRPKKAHKIKGTTIVDVNAKEINVGDRIMIYPGEVVPVDCQILDGHTSLDESSLTGESLPVEKSVGDQLLSGSINISGAVQAKALHSAADSQYQQIIKLVKSAAASQAPFVRLADKYSIPFTASAFMIAGSAWIISGDPLRFLQVLVVATPCPLLLGAPIALISGISRAAKHGIIVKTGSALERLALVETVAFDKTGTLTKGHPAVQKIKTYGTFNQQQILLMSAAIEQHSKHVLAKAVVNEAQRQESKIPKAKQVQEYSGRGLVGKVNGQTIIVGRIGLLKELDVKIPTKIAKDSFSQTASFVAINHQLAGVINFHDDIRPESKTMLAKLKKLGVKHTLMLTGDNQATAEKIATKLGITDVQADCFPADKLKAIEKVPYTPVAFVGDGVNDAPVLTAADVGIALGARGSTAASESADVVIMLDDIDRVAVGIQIAKRTFFIAKQSILIGIFISLGLMAVFFSGKFAPVYGAVLQEFVDVAVIFNALRAHGHFNKAADRKIATAV